MTGASVRSALRTRARGVETRLLARYGDVPRFEHRVESAAFGPPESPSDVFAYAAVCVVRDDAGRVCYVRDDSHEGLDWEPPGGSAEPGERVEATARREVREETGIDCEVRGLLALDRLDVDYDGDGTYPVAQAVLLADATTTDLDPEPGIDAEWFHPDNLPEDAQYADLVEAELGEHA